MNRRLDDLNRRIIAYLHARIYWKRNLRQTERSGIWVLAGTNDLEDWNHREGHVGWTGVWSVCTKAEIHVEECCGVALEPAGLEGDGTA